MYWVDTEKRWWKYRPAEARNIPPPPVHHDKNGTKRLRICRTTQARAICLLFSVQSTTAYTPSEHLSSSSRCHLAQQLLAMLAPRLRGLGSTKTRDSSSQRALPSTPSTCAPHPAGVRCFSSTSRVSKDAAAWQSCHSDSPAAYLPPQKKMKCWSRMTDHWIMG